MGRFSRSLIAVFDAGAMGLTAFTATAGQPGSPLELRVLWGSTLAAGLVAVIVLLAGPPVIAWAAIGYILYAGLLATAQPQVLVLALAIALITVAPRPRESLAWGVLIATVSAFSVRWLALASSV